MIAAGTAPGKCRRAGRRTGQVQEVRQALGQRIRRRGREVVHAPVLLGHRVDWEALGAVPSPGLAAAGADAVGGVRHDAVEDVREAGAEGRVVEVEAEDAEGAREAAGGEAGVRWWCGGRPRKRPPGESGFPSTRERTCSPGNLSTR